MKMNKEHLYSPEAEEDRYIMSAGCLVTCTNCNLDYPIQEVRKVLWDEKEEVFCLKCLEWITAVREKKMRIDIYLALEHGREWAEDLGICYDVYFLQGNKERGLGLKSAFQGKWGHWSKNWY
jgi:hypothetical protein